ncbi:hypothetical protein KIW84_010619 [Lathyrus oleraceus]|uniref:Spen paralogue and orthologue SPOC C-terminal domain-containing protein n=1 Tax=Pisum sativum TaxID=3888 RepID=A0A9D5BDV7_PEA|nr:hypothetical protein KIW84_010619 [Pisum sativum]
MPDVKWTERVEVKGKVKLNEFETYIKDLPNSPNRRLMVARKYVNEGRVGLAKVITGVDLYICPCNYTVLNVLAKYGFYHSNENNDYLIGCVVWKRNQINIPPIEEWSPIREPCKSSVQSYPFPIYNALVKSSEEDTSNSLPYVSAEASLKPEVRPVLVSDVTAVTKQSSPDVAAAILEKEQVVSEFEAGSSIEVSDKRMMEEDMDISPQKKPYCRDDTEIIPNFIPPPPAAKIHPPVLIPRNDFTYLGPALMREQAHSHHAYINPKPDFTYLGPVLMREQANARDKTRTDDFTHLGPKWNAANQPYQG